MLRFYRLTCLLSALFIFIAFASTLSAQDLSINITAPTPNTSNNNFGVCGVTDTVCVEIVADNVPVGETAENVKALFFLEDDDGNPLGAPEGLNVSQAVAKAGFPAPTFSGDTIILPAGLQLGDTYEFGVPVMVGCDFATSGFVQFNFRVDVLSDTTTNGPAGNFNSNDIPLNVGEADISMPVAAGAPVGGYDYLEIEGYDGLIGNTVVDMANAGNGGIDTLYYCISNSALINFTSIDLCQKPAPFGDGVTSVNISTTIQDGGFTCFVITGTDFNNLFPTDPDGADGFGESEAYNVKENYEVVDCGPDETINRILQWGCTAGDINCLNVGPGDFLNTQLTFGGALPEVTATLISQSRPECFGDVNSVSVIDITNVGTAPYTGIYLDINPAVGEIVDYTLVGPGGPISDFASATEVLPGACGAGMLTDSISGTITINPGEIITLTLTLSQDCSCFTSCSVFNVYGGQVRIRGLEESCGTAIRPIPGSANVIINLGNNDEAQLSLDEAPIILEDGQSDLIRNTFNGSTSQFFANAGTFPNAQYQFKIDLPCGFDIGTFTWTDRDGTVFPTAPVITGSNAVNGAQTHTYTFSNGGNLGAFTLAAGHFIEYDLIADCAEYVACNGPIPDCATIIVPLPVSPSLDLITNPICAPNCNPIEIWCPEPTITSIVCTGPPNNCVGGCFSCESFDLERVNFGLGDSNNDTSPDGVANPADLLLNRFIQGDSIKATFVGSVDGFQDADGYEFGYARVMLNHDQFTPFAAEVTYFDSSALTTYTCPVTPYMKEVITADSAFVEVNFSIAELKALGCMTDPGFTNYGDGD